MVYQDGLDANLLQLFAHPENSELFSTISLVIFEVNIATEWKQLKRSGNDIFVFCKYPLPSTLLLPYRCSGVPAANGSYIESPSMITEKFPFVAELHTTGYVTVHV